MLNNIVQYASDGMRAVLLAKVDHTLSYYLVQAELIAHFAKAYKFQSGRDITLEREIVGTLSERAGKETHKYHFCKQMVHIKPHCTKL